MATLGERARFLGSRKARPGAKRANVAARAARNAAVAWLRSGEIQLPHVLKRKPGQRRDAGSAVSPLFVRFAALPGSTLANFLPTCGSRLPIATRDLEIASRRRVRRRRLFALLVVVAALPALALLLAERNAATPTGGKVQLSPAVIAAQPATAQHALASLSTVEFRNPAAVARAVAFVESLQPEGTYILTTAGSDDIVHMDVAHAALALTKAGHVAQAEAALDWLLARMTTRDADDRFGQPLAEGPYAGLPVDYSGSWWDHLATSGDAKRSLTRGRAEGVGLTLIATYAIWQADPDYLDRAISTSGSDRRVIDRVALAAGYIASPAIQHPGGRFNHRPDYTVSFAEEGARMVLGLRLAAEMLAADDRNVEARVAGDAATRGLAALRAGDDVNRGMSYDYYALGIWGLVSPADASAELAETRRARLASRAGVRNWDWQVDNAEKPLDRLRFWFQSQAIAPSETFDWAIAATTAGDYASAVEIERRWLTLQGREGGFPAAYLPAVGVAFGEPTSHSAARFIMLERVLTEALGR